MKRIIDLLEREDFDELFEAKAEQFIEGIEKGIKNMIFNLLFAYKKVVTTIPPQVFSMAVIIVYRYITA